MVYICVCGCVHACVILLSVWVQVCVCVCAHVSYDNCSCLLCVPALSVGIYQDGCIEEQELVKQTGQTSTHKSSIPSTVLLTL